MEEAENVPVAEPSFESRVHAIRLRDNLIEAAQSLETAERDILKKHYFEGKTLDQAGAELGVSKSWASRLHARALELLGDALGHLRRSS
jgi:RNA polymerase sigma factor FliA